ncbi:hypothetical protein [Streptomyces angustmyceticus]|uniref:hypothetical protein n=1 Tax=Streptomyces angustmyceticus TaxID=285578 RepID=UPI003D8C3B53
MTEDMKLEKFRSWVLDVLELISADPGRQVDYLHESRIGSDEILLQFDDVLHVAHARLRDGSMDQDDLHLLQEVDERVDALNSEPASIWTEAALGEAAAWQELRIAAGRAKSELKKSWHWEFT